MQSPLSILFEDNHVLVVNKPAGLATQGALAEQMSVHSEMCRFLKVREQKPGNVYLGIVSRLDASTSGLLVLAKTSKAAARLSDQIRQRLVRKRYLALLTGNTGGLTTDWVHWTDQVLKDEARHRMVLTKAGTPHSQEATLRLRLVELKRLALVYIDLWTGRKHQIRLQCSARSLPVLGDKKYGGRSWDSPGIALHSASLEFLHPVKREPLSFAVSPPVSWSKLGVRLPTSEELLKWSRSSDLLRGGETTGNEESLPP